MKINEPIKLQSGYIFTPSEAIELDVDYNISPDEIIKRIGYASSDWEYCGKQKKGKKKVTALIGTLNKECCEEDIEGILKGSEIKGSGAWVAEAFLELRPGYDGKGGIGFPDSASSRWRSVHDRDVFFPYVWSGGGRRWNRGLDWVRYGFDRADRLCLLASSGTQTSELGTPLEPLAPLIPNLSGQTITIEIGGVSYVAKLNGIR